ncbi:3684_t:CDS:2 [Funneliformis geosporum]|uniref:3684_t:CDS:1 n=1 Tax=Funneliformis geosporum TaxID=1117311 RepID=A0A9W4X187_9GLOM|nr:3684_t:CDS:2 [Funneliformis geosporum]
MKIQQDFKETKKILASHSGFKREKEEFEESINYYIHFQGKLAPLREVICYSGPPGTGKTTFVQTLSKAMGRELEPIPCAGLVNPEEYSILGDQHKPSLVAWAMLKNGCKNPIILLDELEKVTDEKIQADLIKLFKAFKEKGSYKDPYFDEEIDLKYINIFAAVNYDQKLATKLKTEVDLKKLLEKGVRQLEQACHKIIEEHIAAKQTNRPAFQGDKHLAIEFNDKPGTFHARSNKNPELEEIEKYLKAGTNKLTIEPRQNHDFSRVHLLAGEEHNQELTPLKEQINLIDFSQHNHEDPKFIESKIKEIYNNPANQELIKKGEFPVLCFKNIEKIGSNQALEEALLPVFDQQQNSQLFNKEIDLAKFILIATTSTHETEKLSAPLLSRLDWENADTAQPKKFFLDKYYY